jgi:hypothetical protein
MKDFRCLVEVCSDFLNPVDNMATPLIEVDGGLH